MQLEEVVVAALARCAEFGGNFPTARSVYYRRVAVRFAQLRAAAAEWNSDFAAVAGVLPVDFDGDTGTALVDLTGLPSVPLGVLSVAVSDAGTAPYADGTLVNLCRADDPDGALPPRLVLENGGRTLRAIDAAMEGVAEVRLRYVPTPAALPEVATADLAAAGLPAVAHELLVVDLAKWMVTKTAELAPAAQAPIMDSLAREEAELMGLYEHQVQTFSHAPTDRFARPVRQPDTLPAPRS